MHRVNVRSEMEFGYHHAAFGVCDCGFEGPMRLWKWRARLDANLHKKAQQKEEVI